MAQSKVQHGQVVIRTRTTRKPQNASKGLREPKLTPIACEEFYFSFLDQETIINNNSYIQAFLVSK